MTAIKTVQVSYVCDGCGRRVSTIPNATVPAGWHSGHLVVASPGSPNVFGGAENSFRFDACSKECIVSAVCASMGVKGLGPMIKLEEPARAKPVERKKRRS